MRRLRPNAQGSEPSHTLLTFTSCDCVAPAPQHGPLFCCGAGAHGQIRGLPIRHKAAPPECDSVGPSSDLHETPGGRPEVCTPTDKTPFLRAVQATPESRYACPPSTQSTQIGRPAGGGGSEPHRHPNKMQQTPQPPAGGWGALGGGRAPFKGEGVLGWGGGVPPPPPRPPKPKPQVELGF